MNTTTGNSSTAAHEAWRGHAREAYAANADEKLGEATPAEDISAKGRARQARLDANVALRRAELARVRAYRRGRDLAPHNEVVDRAYATYLTASEAYEQDEPATDPFACLPGGGS